VCANLRGGAEQFYAFGGLAHACGCAVEVGGLGGGADDVAEEEVAYCALYECY
jgi:hypothetical protein